MNTIKSQILTVLFIVLFQNGHAQGFVNLDFEDAVITSGGHPFEAVASDAFPGWTAYISGVPQTYIVYNTVPLGAAEVTLQGINGFISPISGNYTPMLWGAFNPSGNPNFESDSAAIGQTGQIPLSTKSIMFWGKIGG